MTEIKSKLDPKERIKEEVVEIIENPPSENWFISDEGDEEIFAWAKLAGAVDRPYEGARFPFIIEFTSDYPKVAQTVKFTYMRRASTLARFVVRERSVRRCTETGKYPDRTRKKIKYGFR